MLCLFRLLPGRLPIFRLSGSFSCICFSNQFSSSIATGPMSFLLLVWSCFTGCCYGFIVFEVETLSLCPPPPPAPTMHARTNITHTVDWMLKKKSNSALLSWHYSSFFSPSLLPTSPAPMSMLFSNKFNLQEKRVDNFSCERVDTRQNTIHVKFINPDRGYGNRVTPSTKKKKNSVVLSFKGIGIHVNKPTAEYYFFQLAHYTRDSWPPLVIKSVRKE